MKRSSPTSDLANIFYSLGIALMVLGALYLCKTVLVPIALSILLAFILNPLVEVFERFRIGRIPSVLLSSFLAFAVIGIVSWILAGQLKHLADDLPSHTHEIKLKIESFKASKNSTIGRLSGMLEDIFPHDSAVVGEDGKTTTNHSLAELPRVVLAEPTDSKISGAVETLLPVVEPLATVALVIVLVLFLLMRREDMRYRVISLMGEKALTGTTRLMRDTADRVSSYLLNLLMVNAAFGIWFGTGLYFIGVPYSPLWGALTMFFRFIPFLGSPASVLFPLLISFATSSGWGEPISVLIFFAISELVTANIIEPVLFGKTTGLTPIALLIAALFWAWIWGPIGLLLSTPLTVCLVVLGQHIPQLRSLKVLLAEQPVLEARLQYFQRLLAQDKAEARRVLDRYEDEFDREKTFDDVVVPALRWTRRERFKEVITVAEEQQIWQTNGEILTESWEDRLAESAKSDDEDADGVAAQVVSKNNLPTDVYGYPVHHNAEEIALAMLGELLNEISLIRTCTTQKLPAEAIGEISAMQPVVVVLAVLPPGGMPQANFMCTEIRDAFPPAKVIVMYLGVMHDFDDMLVKIRKSGASYLTTSLSQTKTQIKAIFAERDKASAANDDRDVEPRSEPKSPHDEDDLETPDANDNEGVEYVE